MSLESGINLSGEAIQVELEMSRLESAAESTDERKFIETIKQVNWTAQGPEEYLRAIKLALKVGAQLVARELSQIGAKRFAEFAELQKYARILAPPKIIKSDKSNSDKSNKLPNYGLRANRDWLQTNRKQYQGQWVALQNGVLMGIAESLNELIEKVGDTTGKLITKVF